jgi:hypothetical protein
VRPRSFGTMQPPCDDIEVLSMVYKIAFTVQQQVEAASNKTIQDWQHTYQTLLLHRTLMDESFMSSRLSASVRIEGAWFAFVLLACEQQCYARLACACLLMSHTVFHVLYTTCCTQILFMHARFRPRVCCRCILVGPIATTP